MVITLTLKRRSRDSKFSSCDISIIIIINYPDRKTSTHHRSDIEWTVCWITNRLRRPWQTLVLKSRRLIRSMTDDAMTTLNHMRSFIGSVRIRLRRAKFNGVTARRETLHITRTWSAVVACITNSSRCTAFVDYRRRELRDRRIESIISSLAVPNSSHCPIARSLICQSGSFVAMAYTDLRH